MSAIVRGFGLFVATLICAPQTHSQMLGGRTYPFRDASLKGEILAEDPKGLLWVGTTRGLYRLDGYRYLPVGKWAGIPEETIVGLTVTADGTVWTSSDSGLYRLRGARASRVSPSSVPRNLGRQAITLSQSMT